MSFDDQTVLDVWRNAQPVSGYDSSIQRKDQCGAWIKLSDYGNRTKAQNNNRDQGYQAFIQPTTRT